MSCSICLNSLHGDIFSLSCSHKFHINCFLSLVYDNDMNIFIKCPLCRKLNHNNLNYTEFHDLKIIVPIRRCGCMTRDNKRCRKNSIPLNNGMCYIHNSIVLNKDQYILMCDYILWLFESAGSFRTKYIMIDIAKKLCIKYDTIKNIQDILHYFYYFYHENDKSNLLPREQMYYFFQLSDPPNNLLEMMELSKKNLKLII